MENVVSSEVNSFTLDVEDSGDLTTSKFLFSVPPELKYSLQRNGFQSLRRSRSNPIGLEDSDEEDIEVPRFTSLDHENLDDLEYDSDGDLDLPRYAGDSRADFEMIIQHRKKTIIKNVGLQVWRGSLLLSDFFLHNYQEFSDKTVLEVGSGTGLASIVASICGARAIASDMNNCDILELIKSNCSQNKSLMKNGVEVRALDFGDNLEGLDFINDVDVIAAGDINYDNMITDKFIEFLQKYRKKKASSTVAYIALEKRYVFTIADLDTVAPAFDYFEEKLKELCDKDNRLSYSFESTDFPQYFCYEKSQELVIIKIIME